MVKIFVLIALLLISHESILISCSDDYEDYKDLFTDEATTEAPVKKKTAKSIVRLPEIKINVDEEWESPEVKLMNFNYFS